MPGMLLLGLRLAPDKLTVSDNMVDLQLVMIVIVISSVFSLNQQHGQICLPGAC